MRVARPFCQHHVPAMPYIRQVPIAEATGFLKKQFDQALERAGRVWHIVHIMSQNPRTMDASMKFYGAIMFGPSPLTRWQREMLAVVTSKANDCFY
jgi:alkylhydroperoxidase family enzyme